MGVGTLWASKVCNSECGMLMCFNVAMIFRLGDGPLRLDSESRNDMGVSLCRWERYFQDSDGRSSCITYLAAL